jgi:DNA polymerase (family 10)
MKNKEIASLLSRIGDALEIQGEVGFKVIAYRKAARVLEDLTEDIENIAAQGRLQQIPGIGSGMAKKIQEYIETGEMTKYRQVISEIPESLLDLLEIQDLGPRTIHLVYKELGVKTLDDLKFALADGSLAGLHGLGEKTAENIRKGIEIFEQAQERIPIFEGVSLVEEISEYLKSSPLVGRLSPAGSVRRMKETVGDIDILATGREGGEIISHFTRFAGVTNVLVTGETKGSVMVSTSRGERQVDLRIVDVSEYGAALQYFTGSKAHNVKLRSMAKEKGLKISEYGVFRGRKKIAGHDEKSVYQALGLPLIPPELREDRGEVELASENKLPPIVDSADIQGDLHVHSQYSDGSLSLTEIADVARDMGYTYVAICDHSQSVKYAHGLSPERLQNQVREIDKLNRKLRGIKILKATEVDILSDGGLDFPDRLLKQLDIVVAAIHTGFSRNVTQRIIRAMDNPWVTIIAHPTGRLISKREGYEVDLDQVLAAAEKKGKALELNAYYDRLDLDEFNLKKAKEKGINISIGTDSHSPEGFQMMRFGVGIARRAWLEKEDILNSRSYNELLKKKG